MMTPVCLSSSVEIWKGGCADKWGVRKFEIEQLCIRKALGKCLNVVEQGELVRDEIEDMIRTMGDKQTKEEL